MPRPREFDEDVVTERSLERFRLQHYASTSTADLCEATGLSRSSLYGAFGSKRALYLICLRRYADQRTREQDAVLEADGPAVDKLRALLLGALDAQASDTYRRACLFVDAAIELGPADPEVADLVARQLDRMTSTVEILVRVAQREGAIDARWPAPHVALVLGSLLNGNHVALRVRDEARSVRDAVQTALSAFAAA